MNKPEILSPAGNPEKLKFAINYGADAVYCALDRFGLRAASENFTPEQLSDAVNYAHARKVKLYVTLNVMPRDGDFESLRQYLHILAEIKPDALIIADAGVLMESRKIAPHIPIHLSTQANTLNSSACEFWMSAGVTRIVLARELTLKDIADIRKNCPKELELEAFVHGAMCVAYSGRCLLSGYLTGRSGNEGRCAQPCRWHYYVTEEKRPDTHMPLEEDKYGSYLFSSKDMCMLRHIPELVEAGISSFKIEGRVKSACYAAVVTNAYRMALDSFIRDDKNYIFDEKLMDEVESVSHREYSTGFYFGSPSDDANIVKSGGYIRDKAFLATVEEFDAETKLARCIQRNKMCVGDTVNVLSPKCTGRDITVKHLFDENMAEITSTPHPMMTFYMHMDRANAGDIIRGI